MKNLLHSVCTCNSFWNLLLSYFAGVWFWYVDESKHFNQKQKLYTIFKSFCVTNWTKQTYHGKSHLYLKNTISIFNGRSAKKCKQIIFDTFLQYFHLFSVDVYVRIFRTQFICRINFINKKSWKLRKLSTLLLYQLNTRWAEFFRFPTFLLVQFIRQINCIHFSWFVGSLNLRSCSI